MRRFQLGLVTIALPVLAFALFLAGCSKDEKKTGGGGGGGDVAKETPKESTGPAKEMEPKNGVLQGKITLAGAPDIDSLEKELQTAINQKADQKDFCLSAKDPSEKTEQVYRLGSNNQLGNVIVWVTPEPGSIFKVTPEQLKAAKDNALRIHQPHCAFIPHCAAVFASYYPDPKNPKKGTPTGAHIKIGNDAENSHNTNWKAGSRNPSGNETLAPKKEIKVEPLTADSTVMTLQCTIHPWMNAFVRLLDTPYFAVTYSDTLDGKNKVEKSDAKFGTYKIENLPIGNVRVFAWHERIGFLNPGGGRSGDKVEIKEGAPTEKDFKVAPK